MPLPLLKMQFRKNRKKNKLIKNIKFKILSLNYENNKIFVI